MKTAAGHVRTAQSLPRSALCRQGRGRRRWRKLRSASEDQGEERGRVGRALGKAGKDIGFTVGGIVHGGCGGKANVG